MVNNVRPQHLTCVRAAAAVCGAHLEGAELGSQTLAFVPGGPPCPGEYIFDVAEAAQGGSAGSVSLVLQTILLPLALTGGESRLTLRGAAHTCPGLRRYPIWSTSFCPLWPVWACALR